MSFMRDPRESLDALKEFVTSPEAMKQLGAQVVATIETQVDEINEALDKGGDANAEDLGRKAGHTFSLVVGTIANGGSGAASKSVTLSRMGIDVSSKELEGLVTKVKANGLRNEIAQVEKLGRDSDVPVIDPIAESGPGTKTTDKTPLPSYYREDSSAGAAVTQADLPEGYTRVLNTNTGNFEVRSPTGDLQFPDSEGNLIPKDGGKLAQQKQAEERIAGAKAAGEIPPTRPLALPSPEFNVPGEYRLTRNADGTATVEGPRGGLYNSTGRYTSEGKPVYRDNSGGYVTLDGGRTNVSAPISYESIPIHHICSNKCTSGANGQIAWTKEYQRFFDGADLNINRATEDLVAVPGHRGPHPIEYHQYVYGSLEQATQGLAPGTPTYKAAVTNTLDGIKKEAVIVGSEVNKWLTRD